MNLCTTYLLFAIIVGPFHLMKDDFCKMTLIHISTT